MEQNLRIDYKYYFVYKVISINFRTNFKHLNLNCWNLTYSIKYISMRVGVQYYKTMILFI